MDDMQQPIVAAVVDDEPTAAALASDLEQAGVDPIDIDRFNLNQAGQHHGLPFGGDEGSDKGARGGGSGALTGAGIGGVVGAVIGAATTPLVGPAGIVGGMAAGAYTGALAGGVSNMGDKPHPTGPVRPPGIMVAVRLPNADRVRQVADTMRAHGARFIERAQGQWQQGRWSDFDPVAPPHDVVYSQR